MALQAGINNSYNGGSDSGVAENSLSLTAPVFLNATADATNDVTLVGIAAAGETIVGVNYTVGTFASDNQSNAQRTVQYFPTKLNKEYIVDINGGTVTGDDEGQLFDLTATGGNTVDGTTASSSTGQLRLTRFISATQSAFEIANL